MSPEDKTIGVVGGIVVVLALAGTTLGLWGCPHYNVWQKRLEGEAELAKADQNRRIAVTEAQAKMDSAKMLADAEVARAKGVAEANKIIGESLKGNDSYLRYLWIQSLNDTGDQTIVYIPTEANLPVLEAARLRSESK